MRYLGEPEKIPNSRELGRIREKSRAKVPAPYIDIISQLTFDFKKNYISS
jgi:hypothetical protein